MKFTIELDSRLSFPVTLLCHQLVTDRETKFIVVRDPGDRTPRTT